MTIKSIKKKKEEERKRQVSFWEEHDSRKVRSLGGIKSRISFKGRFYGPALYPLDVRVLRFVDTPLRLIEEHSFLGVNRTLQELYVINSTLEKFPRQALQILGNLSILSIAGHRISTLPVDSFADSAAAAKIEKLEISNGTIMLFCANVNLSEQ